MKPRIHLARGLKTEAGSPNRLHLTAVTMA